MKDHPGEWPLWWKDYQRPPRWETTQVIDHRDERPPRWVTTPPFVRPLFLASKILLFISPRDWRILVKDTCVTVYHEIMRSRPKQNVGLPFLHCPISLSISRPTMWPRSVSMTPCRYGNPTSFSISWPAVWPRSIIMTPRQRSNPASLWILVTSVTPLLNILENGPRLWQLINRYPLVKIPKNHQLWIFCRMVRVYDI